MLLAVFKKSALRLKATVLRPSLFISLICLLISVNAQAAQLTQGRLWQAPDHLRLVFDLSASTGHKVFMLSKPARLVIDIADTELKTTFEGLKARNAKLKTSPIKRIRWAKRKDNTLRIVLDLNHSVRPKSLPLPPNKQYGNRLMLDLYDVATKKTVKKVAKTLSNTKSKKRDLIIAVDAGHGGEDPGALGPGRAREKVVVLAIAKELKRVLEQRAGITVKLTRKGDYYIPLRKRTRLAREYGADLMVSVHADSFGNSQAHGASVYALSPRGATSEAARWLARKENSADLIGGDGSLSLEDKDDTLASVLLDLSQTASLKSSLRVGARVLKSMRGVAKLHKPRVEQAGFVVLKSPDIPSILVETGFISNPAESRRLITRRYQKKMARAIKNGVLGYFKSYPIDGTLLSWQQAQDKKGVVVASIVNKR